VNEEERQAALKANRQFCQYFDTSDYFKITKQINIYCIEGFLGRKDRSEPFFETFDSALTYFIDYKKRQDIFFTFDKTILYQVTSIFPERPFRFILKQSNKQIMQEESTDKLIHQTIINAGDGNTITTGNQNNIKINSQILKGNLDALKQELAKQHVSNSDIEEIAAIVQEERPNETNKLGTKTNNWIQKMLQKSLDGSWQIGVATAGGLLTELLKSFFGIH
jgi:hypothetical protein